MKKPVSVMIVDDEKLTIEDLCTIVDWRALGFEIVATAFNGRQALRKYQEYHPQVIFTDIKMPFMDGIEMLSNLRKADEKVHIILLTAYEDFGYAKAAIRYGITEYIIKSEITADSITELLVRLYGEIEKQNKMQLILTDKMMEQFFLSNQLDERQVDNRFFSKPYYILLVEQDLPVNISGEQLPTELIVSRTEITDIMGRQNYGRFCPVAIGGFLNGRVMAVLDTVQVSQTEIFSALREIANQIKRNLMEQTSRSFTVYVAQNRISLEELKRTYREDGFLFRKKYMTGSGAVILLENFGQIHESLDSDFNKKQLEELLQDLLENHNIEALRHQIQEHYRSVMNDGNVKKMRVLSCDLYYLLKRGFESLPESMQNVDLSIENNWKEWLDGKKICSWFIRQFEKLNEGMVNRQRAQYSRAILAAIDYIYRNYPNPELSINDVADDVHLSTGYLCAMFKQEVGVTLKNFITDIRIEAAKKLMDKGELKVYEIGAAVGYQSSQYFSQVFYKKVGMFPTEYRKKD